MVTKGHERGRKEGHQQKKNNQDMDLEFDEIRDRMERLSFKMQ